jgi:hypothetical protein
VGKDPISSTSTIYYELRRKIKNAIAIKVMIIRGRVCIPDWKSKRLNAIPLL